MPVLNTQVKSTIAHDQTEVDTKFRDLMFAWNITADEIKEFEVTPFGACQFLITVLFSGPYVLLSRLGLVSTRARLLKMTRTNKPLFGLHAHVARLLRMTRTNRPLLGLHSHFERWISYSRSAIISMSLTTAISYYWKDLTRVFTSALGAVANIVFVWVDRSQWLASLLGFTSTVDRDLAMLREGAPGLGLAIDVAFDWHRP